MALTALNNDLLLDGVSLRHIGVNSAYLLARRWYTSTDTQHIETLDKLAELGIKVIRCVAIPNAAGSGGGLATWGTTTGLSASFYTAQDVIFDYAATKGIQIIPTLFSNYWSVANYKSEKLNQLGVLGSAMQTYLRTCATEYVTHYLNHPAIAAWEITNEWNNYAELQAYPSGLDYTGAAYNTDAANLITISNFITSIKDVATQIRTVDTTSAILSGNAGPWLTTKDSLDGYEGRLAAMNPDPINTISLHVYSYPTNNVWCRNGFEPLGSIIGAAKRVGRSVGKPVILGEVGVSEQITTKDKDFSLLFKHLTSEEAAPLTLLWNFYKPGSSLPDSNDNYDFYTTGLRTKYVEKLIESNTALSQSKVEEFDGAVPTKYLVLNGTQAAYTAIPLIEGNFSLSFWARHDGLINRSYPRIISATSDESTNGFTITQLGTTDATFGEPYFRLFNGTAQSATLRTGAIQDLRWKHFTYVFKSWTTSFTANPTQNSLALITEQPQMQTGDVIRFTTTGTLPAGLSLATDYYVIREDSGVCYVASGQGNAYFNTKVDITDAGIGTHTIRCMSVAVYQNGLKSTGDSATTFTGTWVTPTGNLVLGANHTFGGDFFKGHLAKVRIWQRGLTELEAWEDFTGNTPIGDTSYLVDNTTNLTLVNAPTWVESLSRTIVSRSAVVRSLIDKHVRQ